ncbi:MAG: FecR family protein [Mangrovibacterium sp.]
MDSENKIWTLIGGQLNHELSEEELSLFETIVQDEREKRLFNRMETIHSGLNEMKQIHRFSKDSSWFKIGRHIRQTKLRRQIIRTVAYAAIVVMVFFIGNVFYSKWFSEDIPVQYAKIDVNYGQTCHLTLFDETEVWLNSGSTLRYPDRFNSGERKVYVNGEAFFKVTPNKKAPFIVHTGQMEIEVLGTSFNVSAYPNDSAQSVVLVEGSVRINNTKGNKIGELRPGQIAFQNPDQSIRVQQVNTSAYTTWKDGILNFREEKLEAIARKLERWYNIEIRFENENLKGCLITGTVLRDKPIDQIIDILEMIAPVKFEYLIRPDKKSNLIVKERKDG